MLSRSFVQKKRKAFSWLFVAALGTLIVFSEGRWEQVNVVSDVLFSVGLVFIAVATVGRLWCSLYICGYKTNTLITTGPYSVCRNPLYFFSLLGGIGLGLASETLTVTILVLAAFALYYPLVIRAEETRLRAVHGGEFDRYAETTPRFWPSLRKLDEPEEYTVKPRLFRNSVMDAMVFVWMAGVLEFIEALHEHHMIQPLLRLY